MGRQRGGKLKLKKYLNIKNAKKAVRATRILAEAGLFGNKAKQISNMIKQRGLGNFKGK